MLEVLLAKQLSVKKGMEESTELLLGKNMALMEVVLVIIALMLYVIHVLWFRNIKKSSIKINGKISQKERELSWIDILLTNKKMFIKE